MRWLAVLALVPTALSAQELRVESAWHGGEGWRPTLSRTLDQKPLLPGLMLETKAFFAASTEDALAGAGIGLCYELDPSLSLSFGIAVSWAEGRPQRAGLYFGIGVPADF